MVGPDGYVKLIDFGSASTDIIKPEIDWSSKQRTIVEEELATVTTPM
jgi:cyclin G-associated kinase